MALRSDTQGDRVEFSGPFPASSRPISVCGFARVSTKTGNWCTLVSLPQGSDHIQIGVNIYSPANLSLFCEHLTGSDSIFESVSTGLSLDQNFFWGVSLPSGTAKPTLFWRALSTLTLSTNTPSGTTGTWSFTPSSLVLSYSAAIPTEWGNVAQSGVRVWNRALSLSEMNAESLSLRPKSWNGCVLAVPGIKDGKDISAFGGGRIGTPTGITVEVGPPVRW